MSALFSENSPLWRAMTKLADLIWVNILFVVCCIPVFTIGASMAAMYSVTFKIATNEEGAISQDFFKAFKENFKQATILWLIMLGLGAFIVVDLFLAAYLPGSFRDAAHVFLAVIGVVYLLTFGFLFPLQSRFANPIKLTLINALVLSVKHLLPTGIAVGVLAAVPVVIVAFAPYLIEVLLPFILLILFSGIAFFVCKILNPIFLKYFDLQQQRLAEQQQESEVENNDAH